MSSNMYQRLVLGRPPSKIQKAKELDRLTNTYETGNIYGRTQSGRAYIQIDDKFNKMIACATFEWTEIWENYHKFMNDQMIGFERDDGNEEGVREIESGTRCEDPPMEFWID